MNIDHNTFTRYMIAALPSLRGQAYRLTRKGDEVEDLVQDTVVRGLTRYDKWFFPKSDDVASDVRRWLCAVMGSIYFHRRRKGDTHTKAHERIHELNETVSQFTPTLDDHIRLIQLDKAVNGALSTMNAGQRDAFLLHTVDELTYTQIAAQLNVAPGTILSRLYRARQHIKGALGEDRREFV